MKKSKISVIIPFYNVEKYLDKCLNSVRKQSLKDIEIICVDDCSPDNSYKIAEKHANEDSRIRIIRHKKNLGLGGARNTAIHEATADYVASVDSDDYMLPNMLERLWEEAEKGKFDIVCCGFEKVDESGEVLAKSFLANEVATNDNNSIDIFTKVNPAFWNKLWKRSLFIENHIFFPEHLYFEDMPTMPRLLAKSANIKIIQDRLYHYLIRPDSITASYSAKHIMDYFQGFELLLDFLEENDLINRYKSEFLSYIDTNMTFYSTKILESSMDKYSKSLYLRHLLIMKVGFISLMEKIKSKSLDELELVRLLKTARTIEDFTKSEES